MKKNPLFEKCLSCVAPEVREEVRLNIDIANRIYDILKAKNMTQREFAALMGKRESEISRWLTGSHGFTTTTLAKISAVLGEPVVQVTRESDAKYVFIPMGTFVSRTDAADGNYTDNNNSHFRIAYAN